MRVNYRFSFEMLFRSNTNSCPGQNSLKNQIRFGSLNSLPQEILADIKPFLPAPASPVPVVLEVLLFNRIQLKFPVGYVSRSFSLPYFSLMAIKFQLRGGKVLIRQALSLEVLTGTDGKPGQ